MMESKKTPLRLIAFSVGRRPDSSELNIGGVNISSLVTNYQIDTDAKSSITRLNLELLLPSERIKFDNDMMYIEIEDKEIRKNLGELIEHLDGLWKRKLAEDI
jgi:hypothetical protein